MNLSRRSFLGCLTAMAAALYVPPLPKTVPFYDGSGTWLCPLFEAVAESDLPEVFMLAGQYTLQPEMSKDSGGWTDVEPPKGERTHVAMLDEANFRHDVPTISVTLTKLKLPSERAARVEVFREVQWKYGPSRLDVQQARAHARQTRDVEADVALMGLYAKYPVTPELHVMESCQKFVHGDLQRRLQEQAALKTAELAGQHTLKLETSEDGGGWTDTAFKEAAQSIRELTGVGLMECRYALKKTGSVEQAIEFLHHHCGFPRA